MRSSRLPHACVPDLVRLLMGIALLGATSMALAEPDQVLAQPMESRSRLPRTPASMTVGQVLDQRAQAEGWCVVWNAPFEPVGPARPAWRYTGPGDSLDKMVERGVEDWDRPTSASLQITAAGDGVPRAVHAKLFLSSRLVDITPKREDDRSPPGLRPLFWGRCDAVIARGWN